MRLVIITARPFQSSLFILILLIENVILADALVKLESLFFKEVLFTLLYESMFVGTVKISELLDAVLLVLINLSKLVDHQFVKTSRRGLKIFFHSVQRLHG